MTREQTSIPNIEYVTADGRFDDQRLPIDLIVLHSTAGNLQSAINLFGNTPAAGKETSAHYIIENDGKLYQGLEEFLVAYHCGNYGKNQRSIGIEHVDNGATVKLHTDAQYEMSAKLVADICKFYNIPCDSGHIVPHNSITATSCPNGLDVNRIIARANVLLGNSPAPVDDCPAKLLQVTQERDKLNKVIGEVKDPLIERWNKLATILQISAENMAKAPELCFSLIQEMQKTVAGFPAQIEGKLAEEQSKCQRELSDQRTNLLTEFSNEKLTMQKDFDKQLADAKKNTKIVYKYKETPLVDLYKGKSLKIKMAAIGAIFSA
jgi:hypothetical protein